MASSCVSRGCLLNLFTNVCLELPLEAMRQRPMQTGTVDSATHADAGWYWRHLHDPVKLMKLASQNSLSHRKRCTSGTSWPYRGLPHLGGSRARGTGTGRGNASRGGGRHHVHAFMSATLTQVLGDHYGNIDVTQPCAES